jgi:ubiquinone/menaquinone biosynthesis C-methylase UbiE
MKKINLNEILAYKKINLDKSFIRNTHSDFIPLLKLSRKCKGDLFQDLKVYMVLTIKWHFDYLAKTGLNPSFLNTSINFWYKTFLIFLKFQKYNWIQSNSLVSKNNDVWKNTRKAFNFMWPKNTNKRNFDISKVLAELRIEQILKVFSKKKNTHKNFFKDKVILDSGCGPGRYIYSLLKFKPKKIIGIDSGKSIIAANRLKFKKHQNVQFLHSRIDKINLESNTVDFVISAGVLHHTNTSIAMSIKEHSRIIKPKGYFFIFIAGSGGQELELWNFCRKTLEDIDISYTFNILNEKISPLRLQGFLDHSYGEYKSTTRIYFEKILKNNFSKVIELKGVNGADVTKYTFPHDNFFKKRFGSGNLRYLCIK